MNNLSRADAIDRAQRMKGRLPLTPAQRVAIDIMHEHGGASGLGFRNARHLNYIGHTVAKALEKRGIVTIGHGPDCLMARLVEGTP